MFLSSKLNTFQGETVQINSKCVKLFGRKKIVFERMKSILDKKGLNLANHKNNNIFPAKHDFFLQNPSSKFKNISLYDWIKTPLRG